MYECMYVYIDVCTMCECTMSVEKPNFTLCSESSVLAESVEYGSHMQEIIGSNPWLSQTDDL